MARRQKTETSGEEPKGGKRRGLGALGLRTFQQAAPELTLLPPQSSFGAAELEELSGLRPAELRRISRDFPALEPGRAGGPRRYSRQQVELLLRVKRLLLEQELPLEQVRQRLLALEAAPPPRKALLPPAPAKALAAAPALPALAAPAGAPALPAELLLQLRGELEALVALCNEPDT